MTPGVLVNGVDDSELSNRVNGRTERPLCVYDDVHMDPRLKPKNYQIKVSQLPFDISLSKAAYSATGTKPDSKILFLDVNILDSTGAEPYRGGIYIEGERIAHVGSVPDVDIIQSDPEVRMI